MWNALLDLIYPPYLKCIFCSRLLNSEEKHSICPGCYKEIPFIPENACLLCSKPFSLASDESICKDCRGEEHYFKNALSVVQYDGNIKKVIYNYKYNSANYLGRYMAEMMVDLARRERIQPDLIMAVPLHPKREKKRGYNQAHILARYISRGLDIPYGRNYIIRKKYTGALHELSKTRRENLMKDAFEIPAPSHLEGKDILLIDDIYTTGSTVNACSKVLKKAGARSITVLTFARGI